MARKRGGDMDGSEWRQLPCPQTDGAGTRPGVGNGPATKGKYRTATVQWHTAARVAASPQMLHGSEVFTHAAFWRSTEQATPALPAKTTRNAVFMPRHGTYSTIDTTIPHNERTTCILHRPGYAIAGQRHVRSHLGRPRTTGPCRPSLKPPRETRQGSAPEGALPCHAMPEQRLAAPRTKAPRSASRSAGPGPVPRIPRCGRHGCRLCAPRR